MSAPSFAEAVADDLETLRARAPPVHNITNFVAMNLTANMLLALGASPVMAHGRIVMTVLDRVMERCRPRGVLGVRIGAAAKQEFDDVESTA